MPSGGKGGYPGWWGGIGLLSPGTPPRDPISTHFIVYSQICLFPDPAAASCSTQRGFGFAGAVLGSPPALWGRERGGTERVPPPLSTPPTPSLRCRVYRDAAFLRRNGRVPREETEVSWWDTAGSTAASAPLRPWDTPKAFTPPPQLLTLSPTSLGPVLRFGVEGGDDPPPHHHHLIPNREIFPLFPFGSRWGGMNRSSAGEIPSPGPSWGGDRAVGTHTPPPIALPVAPALTPSRN